MLNMPIILIIILFIIIMLATKFNLNMFITLIFSAILIGVLSGMSVDKISQSLSKGIGESLGNLLNLFIFGSIIGQIIKDSGAVYSISDYLTNRFGKKNIQITVIILSFITGISLFFELGMVLLSPIIYAIATEAGIPILILGIPMTMSLITCHALLPPHPAPVFISKLFGVNIEIVLLVGVAVAIPVIVLSYTIYSYISRRFFSELFGYIHENDSNINKVSNNDINEKIPSFTISLVSSIMPVILIIFSFIFRYIKFNINIFLKIRQVFISMGNPTIAMSISLIFVIIFMKKYVKHSLGECVERAISDVIPLVLIIASSSALKQILLDVGLAKIVSNLFMNIYISPLILAWVITALIKIIIGSATVSSITAASIILKITTGFSHSQLVLLILAIGAGSIAFSHVNDAGFWIYKKIFRMSITNTLKTWTVFNTLISLFILSVILIIDTFIS